jgi:tetratricopeptide (TPR) repeat protein
MKFSNNTLFYPDNKALEQAMAHYKSLVSDEVNTSADNTAAVTDNFIYTRGNFEQHRYSTNVLESAKEIFEAALTKEMPESESDRSLLEQAAATQNSLGNILSALGQRTRDVDSFTAAIACFNNALEIFSQETSPLEWAATQYNLATAMQALGRQESDAKLLNKAIDAYTNALLEWSRKETPEEWSSAMHQLGVTFHTYGTLLKGNRTLQKSVVAFKNALAELNADEYALELAATHNNRAAVLHNLGESEDNAERIEEAIRAYETALTVCMEQQLPFHLAVLCRVNKATAHSVLAELTKDTALADETADEFELIIECFPHALQPLSMIHCKEQLLKTREMAAA